MTSSLISRLSACVLFLGGATLLFGSDVVLPALVPGFPPAAAWLGQLLGSGWLAIAALNWLQRSTVLGGIYGRPTVLANFTLYFVSALSLLRGLSTAGAPRIEWLAAGVASALAVAYGALLFHGPFGHLSRGE